MPVLLLTPRSQCSQRLPKASIAWCLPCHCVGSLPPSSRGTATPQQCVAQIDRHICQVPSSRRRSSTIAGLAITGLCQGTLSTKDCRQTINEFDLPAVVLGSGFSLSASPSLHLLFTRLDRTLKLNIPHPRFTAKSAPQSQREGIHFRCGSKSSSRGQSASSRRSGRRL